MDLGGFFGSIGNAIGSMFGGDQQKKKQYQPAPQQRVPSATPTQPQQPAGGVQQPQSFLAGNTFTNSMPNTPPQLGGVKVAAPTTPDPFGGLSNEDRNTAQTLKNQGGDPTKFIAAAHNANAAQNQSDYDNSFMGKFNNAAEDVGGGIVKGTLQAAPRLYNTFTSTDANNNPQWVKDVNSQLGYKTDDLQSSYHLDANGHVDPLMGTVGVAGDLASLIPGGALAAKALGRVAPVLGTGIKAIGESVPAIGTVTNAVADPLSLLEKIPQATKLGRILNTNIATAGRNDVTGALENEALKDAGSMIKTEPAPRPVETPTEPNTPVTNSPTTGKAPAVTSANPNFRSPVEAPQVQAPRLFDNGQDAPTTPPAVGGIEPVRAPAPQAQTSMAQAASTQEQAAAAQVKAALDKASTEPAPQPEAAAVAPAELPTAELEKQMAAQAAPAPQEAIAAVKEADATPPAKLGTITRQSVRDGSIKTPEGLDKTISDTTAAAHSEAQAAGDTLENIIKKGQAVWEKNPKASAREASDLVDGFTPEQQQVYKDYGQELHTLRDRSGHSLNGGNQGAWYGPRQFLDDAGKSGEYDSSLVNELKRSGGKTDVNGNALDHSSTPYEHYIRRYSNAVDAASQRMVDAVETHATTGEATGIKVPDAAKQKLEDSLKNITDQRDEADRLLAAGETKGGRVAETAVQKQIRQAFNNFIDDIPGTGSTRREAINNVKAMRGQYEQSLTQTLTLSNLVNRAADQGTKVVEHMKQPLVRGLEKVINPIMKTKAMEGADSFALNTTKEARQAANEFAKGTLGREMVDNAAETISSAGAGRNPIAKGIAKVDATVRAGGGMLTQSGDLSTQNVREALQIGASRPEAQGLKTVEDYKKYFADYSGTQKFKDDLAKVEQVQNPKIGLAGGEVQENGGTVSNALSKHVDNFISTQADRIKPGLGKNRGVREVNDLVKGNVTGYAGVTSRVLGTVRDAVLPIKPLRAAAKEAASGDPAAVARATKMAAHAVADTIALYGTAGAATIAAKSGLLGYTGAQPTRGSSDSAYNKANNVPANQWFVNVGGKRVYFDPARPAGAAGVAADIAGSIATGSDPLATATNIGGQIANQAGGSSLPDNYKNAMTGFFDSTATDAEKKYSQAQIQALAAPSTGVLNNVANWTDPTKRSPTNFVEDLKSNIPVLRASTPAAKDSMGNAIPNSKQISGGSSLFSVGKNTDSAQVKEADPVAAEITRLQKIDGSVMPTASNTNAKDGKALKDFGKMLFDDPIYTSADDKGKAALLKDVLAGTSTKGIDSSLNATDKQALLDAKILGGKSKAWLEDNGNNANYTTARYNNAKALGTLTKEDDNLQNKSSLKYKQLEAQVNQKTGADTQLKDLYGQITQSDFKAMLNPDDAENYNPEMATKLYDYDKARTESGVSGAKFTDKPKYNLDPNKGKKGGGSGKNFAFASLPSSLVGTGTSGSGPGKGYANDSPLFKPIASLQAPTVAPIPNGRNISAVKIRG